MGKRREKKRKRFQQELENATLPSDASTTKEGQLPFSIAELGACIKVIQCVTNNEKLLQHSQLRELRKALDPLVKAQIEKYKSSDLPIPAPKRQKTQKESSSDMDQINSTKLRAERMKHLEKLNEEGKEEVLRVLDGVGATHTPNTLLLTSSHADQLQLPAGETVTISDVSPEEENAREEIFVQKPIKCYICKEQFTKLHFYYDQLCPKCADLNYKKRTETVDMTGKICLVTGARVKIGYRCALKLLRCRACVIVTTRFPADAARRFAEEEDFQVWKNNLHIFGLDFRDIGRLEAFCAFIKQRYSRLDVIINNACQTIRRPPAFFKHLLQNEKENSSTSTTSPVFAPLLQENFELHERIRSLKNSNSSSIAYSKSNSSDEPSIEEVDDNMETIPPVSTSDSNSRQTAGNSRAVHGKKTPAGDISNFSVPVDISSAEMTQIPLVDGDDCASTSLFPTEALDVNAQQVDLRTKNSWMLKLDEVSTPELAEVMLINAMAPTIINSKLKSLMEFDVETPKFIVNVSAMEGKFYRYKSETHPHTNMAKAALNMMTRTSAQDYKKANIYMTAVDTGWINDEKPLVKAVNHMKQHNFQTPLDEIDAAARVLDPVIAPLLDLAQGRKFDPPWGIFLKDYTKCEW